MSNISNSNSTIVFIYCTFQQCSLIQEVVEERGFMWISNGVTIHEKKVDPGGRHLVQNTLPFALFCIGNLQLWKGCLI